MSGFTVKRGSKKICEITLTPMQGDKLETTAQIAQIQIELFLDKDSEEVTEFIYYYVGLPAIGSNGRLMDGLKSGKWGYSDFNNVEYVLQQFPSPWNIKVNDEPKLRLPDPPPPEGAIR
jgi:hypothetical protein